MQILINNNFKTILGLPQHSPASSLQDSIGFVFDCVVVGCIYFDFEDLFPLLIQKPQASVETHQNPGTPASASLVSQPATSGGAQTPDGHTIPPDAAM